MNYFSFTTLVSASLLFLACNPSDGSDELDSSEAEVSQVLEKSSVAISLSSAIQLSSQTEISNNLSSVENLLSSTQSSSFSTNRPDGWTNESHDQSASANYSLIFPRDKVQEMIIHLHKDTLDTMVYRVDPDFRPFTLPSPQSFSSNVTPPIMNRDYESQYHHCDVEYNGKKWTNVGIKLKGNATLSTSFVWGIYKMPFKLKFDAFEDEYPEVDDQRFYGIKKLGLNNHISDNSQMRERISAEAMRDFGVPAPRITHFNIKVNNGTELIDFGVYSIVEYVGNEYLKSEFGLGDGNLYKPGDSDEKVGWKSGIPLNQNNFEKKTNESSDWSEIEDVIAALHARPSATQVWRTNLEAVFNVDGFLKWLAANTAISNWDSYGGADHNYYVYQNPTDSKVNWIAWDLNESFKVDSRVPDLDLGSIDAEAPLISILMQDPNYQGVYETYLKEFQENHLSKLPARVDEVANQIRPFLAKEVFPYSSLGMISSFDSEVPNLKDFIAQRNQEIQSSFPLF